MINFLKTATLVAALTSMTTAAYAEDGHSSKTGWTGEIEASAVFKSGNSNDTALGFAGILTYSAEGSKYSASGFYDTDRYGAAYKMDFDLSHHSFITVGAMYENNEYGAFYERIIANAAFGYALISNENTHWALEAGPAVLWVKHSGHYDSHYPHASEYARQFTGFFGSHFETKVSDEVSLSNKTEFFWGKHLTIENKTALKFKLSSHANVKIGFDVMYDEDAAHGRKNTDTVLRAGFSYSF